MAQTRAVGAGTAGAVLAVLVACAPLQDQPQAARGAPVDVVEAPAEPKDPQGGCWGVDKTLHRAGVMRTPVEIPCPELADERFVAALQRALAVRGYHNGLITGEMDAATRRAVRGYQAGLGFDSDVLTLSNARRLGLVVYRIDDL